MAATMQASGGSRRRGRRRRRPLSDINVTPLVDVMLVLLIVFMISAPLLTTGVSVDLPQARSSPLPGQDEPLSVTIDAQKRILVQDSVTDLAALPIRLQAITQRNKDARIFVRGDKGVDYGTIMAVVSAINRAGFAKVALLTDPAAGSGAASAPRSAVE